MSSADRISFEAVVRPSGGVSMFDDRFAKPTPPSAGRASAAAAELQRLGFRIRHIGTYSISGDGPRELWEQTFQTTLVRQEGVLSHVAGVPFRLPEELSPLVERAYPQRRPQFFDRVSPAAASPLPPRVSYHHLRVPDDVALV